MYKICLVNNYFSSTASEDYIPLIDHPIQLTPERQSTTVTVDILDDSVFEGLEAETFTVRLQFVFIDPPPTDLEALLPNVNVSVNQATVFIIDNDSEILFWLKIYGV